jgi:DNA mismatch repair protein MutS
MEDEFDGIVNYNIAAKKKGDSIIFLRKIVKGATDDSYGIEVAKLAGVPNEVLKRAKEVLASIEGGAPAQPKIKKATQSIEPDIFADLYNSEANEVAQKLKKIDINTITPIEAMNIIFELKKSLTD